MGLGLLSKCLLRNALKETLLGFGIYSFGISFGYIEDRRKLPMVKNLVSDEISSRKTHLKASVV